jgi:glycosyltransferase involved in cell wall biosynthesis
VLIPARNEAHNIGRCLDGILAQQYAPYEVIVVDDASTDATPEILAAYARAHAHIHVVQSGDLPPGWLGKPHACQQAACHARGEWLLFLDADTVPQPALLAALLAHARQGQLDLLTVFPFLELGSFWERVILPQFQTLIRATFPFERLNAPDVRPDEVVANGQCILVRRAAYWQSGGHAAVSSAVLEDVLLARQVRAAGFRIGVVMALAHLRVRMYTNGREVLEGLTKNAVAGYASGGDQSAWAGMRQFLLILVPMWLTAGAVGLQVYDGAVRAWLVSGYALLVWLVAFSFWAILLQRFYALGWWYALLWPFGMLCYGVIALRGFWRIRSGRGINWKGRTYAGR